MDREDRIICVAFLVIQKLWPPLICDDLRVVSIASENKLHFASLLGAIFRDLGRFWEAKMEAKIDFWEGFLRCFFRMRFGIDFGSFFGRPKHEK